MKSLVIISLLFLLELDSLLAQRVDDSLIESAAFITYVRLKDSTLMRSNGSGFLIYMPIDEKTGRVFLITNKHVLPKANESSTITVKIPYKLDSVYTFKEFKIEIYDKNGTLKSNVELNRDKNIDIAAINISYILNSLGISPKFITPNRLIKRSEYQKNKIGIGSEVFIVGYPSSIYDERTASPILRQGIIATSPSNDFFFKETVLLKDTTLPNPLNGFLVDGSVFGGSSGSMVISPESNYDFDPKLLSWIKRGSVLLGIVSRNIVDVKGQSLDIGIVYSGDAILETIEQFK
jgi:hypothetical protein